MYGQPLLEVCYGVGGFFGLGGAFEFPVKHGVNMGLAVGVEGAVFFYVFPLFLAQFRRI